jgi:hypothetical protein
MDEKLKAMEVVVAQHMQMKDSLEKLETPPSVLQQKLCEERERLMHCKIWFKHSRLLL